MRSPFPYYKEMAVQTKCNVGDKPHQKKDIKWMQVGIVAFCVLLVVMCVISFSNFGNVFNRNGGFVTSGALVTGDLAYVDYTMYIGDVPMVTSSLDVFENSSAHHLPMWTQTLDLVAGQQMNVVDDYPLLIDSSYEYPFRMLKLEYNQIATGIVGLAVGESKVVESAGSFFQMTYTKDQMEGMGIDYVNWAVGEVGLMHFPTVNETSNITTMAVRPALVVDKTADEMIFQYGYDAIEMNVVQAYWKNT
jgi:hypothetical protein